MQWKEITWTKRDGEGLITMIDNLGLVEIYKDNTGNCVDINGKRAWSAWKASEDGIRRGMNQHIRNWDYLNSFKVVI